MEKEGDEMSKRMTVAVLAYVLSSAGILLMCQLILEELRKPKGSNMLVFLWLGAWLTHAVMTFAWVRDSKLSRFWPIAGVIFGVSSFLVWPFFAVKSATLFRPEGAIATAGILTAIQAVLVRHAYCLRLGLCAFTVRVRYLLSLYPQAVRSPDKLAHAVNVSGLAASHVEEDYMSKVSGDSHLVEQTMHLTARQLIFIQPQNAIR